MNMITPDSKEYLGNVISSQKNLRAAKREVESPLPLNPISGPTAQAVNEAGSQGPTAAQFYSRGGFGNTAKNIVNNIAQTQRRKQYERAFEEMLNAGEQGAEQLYNQHVEAYGDEIKEWIPHKDLFFDDSGVFMPYKYAQAVAVGVSKFKQNKKKAQDLQTISGVFGNATSRQQAAADLAGKGVNPEDYSKSFGTIPTAVDNANTVKLLAEADKANRWQPSTPKGTTPVDRTYQDAKKSYQDGITSQIRIETALKELRKQKAAADADGFSKESADLAAKIAESTADLELAKEDLKKRKTAMMLLQKSQSTEGRRVDWEATRKADITPEVKRVADYIDENLQKNKNSPRFNELFSNPTAMNSWIDYYLRDQNLDPIIKEEVKKELQYRYSGSTQGSGGIDDQLASELRSRGVPEESIPQAIADIKKRRGQ